MEESEQNPSRETTDEDWCVTALEFEQNTRHDMVAVLGEMDPHPERLAIRINDMRRGLEDVAELCSQAGAEWAQAEARRAVATLVELQRRWTR